MNPTDAKKWMTQWREAAVALKAVREDELQELDEEKNGVISSTFFNVAGEFGPAREETSGLVEQQAWFSILRSR